MTTGQTLPKVLALGTGETGMEAVLDLCRHAATGAGQLSTINPFFLEISRESISAWRPRLAREENALRPLGLGVGVQLNVIQPAGTLEGAARNPLIGCYYGMRDFDPARPSQIREVGELRDRKDRQVSNFYFHSYEGGTGNGLSPQAMRCLKELGRQEMHVAVAFFDPVPHSPDANRVNDLFAFVRDNHYSDFHILIENRMEMEGGEVSPIRIDRHYLGRIGERKRLPGTPADTRLRCQMANEYAARVIDLLVKRAGDLRDIVNLYDASAGPVREARLLPRWVIPCLYPVESFGLEYSRLQAREMTYPLMAAAAVKEGVLCSGAQPWTARYIYVICQIPPGENNKLVQEGDLKKVLIGLTGLHDSRINILPPLHGPTAQVLVLLLGARVQLLDYLRASENRNSIKEGWGSRQAYFRGEGAADLKKDAEFDQQALDAVEQEIRRIGTTQYDLFSYFDEAYDSAGSW